MLSWLETLIPANTDFAFLEYLAAYVLVIAFACIIISVFFGIFSAIFRSK